MTFPVNGVLDNFNRGDEGPQPSANWGLLAYSGMAVVSNQVVASGDIRGGSYWSAATFGPDCEAYITVSDFKGHTNTDVFVFGRIQISGGAPVDGYAVSITKGGNYIFYRIDAYSSLGSGSTTALANGDSIGLSIVGNTLSLYIKPSGGSWTLIDTAIDSNVAIAGYIGISIDDVTGSDPSLNSTLDDFGGGTLASGFTGDLDKTLDGLTLLASGYLERLGALNQTFPALSVQATGTLSAYHVPTLINVRDITATGAGAIGVDVVNNAISQNVRANSLQVENGGSLEAHSVYYDTITTIGTGAIVPLRSDRAVWDVIDYPDRHANDIYGSTWAYHRNPALSGSYTVDHPSVRRILDVTSVSLNEMAALLGTLLDDLGLT